MNTYTLNLKGCKKRNTSDISVTVYGDNIGQARTWAYDFFERGIFTPPYYAHGCKKMSQGTIGFIPSAPTLMHLKGRYKVYATSISFQRKTK